MILELAGAAAAAVWLYLLLFRGGYWLEFRNAGAAGKPAAAPPIVAIIPARNEAETIERAIRSLISQVTHIVVIDDGSIDGTAELARRSAPSGKVSVISSEPLPSAWTGKLWAVHQGLNYAAALPSGYLLLTDADIEHGPGSVALLAARADAGRYDLVSYMATLHCSTFAEKALIPAFVYFFLALYPPAWIRNPRRRTAGAAGGCMLIRRQAMERIGGVKAIHGELIDDCALARAMKQAGGRVWLGLGEKTRSLRVYDGLGEMERMIARTAFTQLRYSVWILAATLAALGTTYFLGPVLAVTAPRPAAMSGAAAWLLMSISYFPALRFYRRSPLWAPMLPVIAGFYAWATLHSAILHWRGRGGMWKGRVQNGVPQR